MPIANDLRIRRGQFLQGGQGFFGAAFLHDAQDGIEHDDRHDSPGFEVVAQQRRDDRSDDQHDDNKVVQLVPQHLPEGRARGFIELVWSDLGKQFCRPACPQAFFSGHL